MRTKVSFLALSILATLATVTLASEPAARAAKAHHGCTNAMLKGDYGSVYNGFLRPDPGQNATLPQSILALATFDGHGSFSIIFDVANFDGVQKGLPDSGTYTVNDDCTASAHFDNAGVNFDFVILDGGAETYGLETDDGVVATVISKRL